MLSFTHIHWQRLNNHCRLTHQLELPFPQRTSSSSKSTEVYRQSTKRTVLVLDLARLPTQVPPESKCLTPDPGSFFSEGSSGGDAYHLDEGTQPDCWRATGAESALERRTALPGDSRDITAYFIDVGLHTCRM